MKSDIQERLRYLEDKIDNIDDMLHKLEQHTKANLIVISHDIHLLYDRLPPSK